MALAVGDAGPRARDHTRLVIKERLGLRLRQVEPDQSVAPPVVGPSGVRVLGTVRDEQRASDEAGGPDDRGPRRHQERSTTQRPAILPVRMSSIASLMVSSVYSAVTRAS